MPQTHARTCHICEANCGLLVEVEGRDILSIRGNPDHVLSRGHICPKGTAIADLQNDHDRLRRPVKKVDGQWREISWETAFAEIAGRLGELKGQGGKPAMYMGNPSAHDYGISTQVGQLRRAIGLKNIYSASTLDQIPHHVVQYHMYGHVSLAAVPDIDRCQHLIIIGGNPAASNGSIWTVPDFKKRVKEMQARDGKLIVVDPRRTETAKLADAHHFVKPGTDTALLIGILKSVFDGGHVDTSRLDDILDDSWADIAPAIADFDLDQLAVHCGIGKDVMQAMAADLAADQPAAIYGRMGVSVCEFGTLNQWLIQVINIATGNLDREGGTMVPEPALDTINLVGRGSVRKTDTVRGEMPVIMGELPTITLADEMLREDEERIRALFVITGNPVLSAPDGAKLDTALEKLDLMVSFDMYVTETSRHADYILPPCGPLEKDHYPFFFGPLAVRNYASYSPAIFDIPEGEKADWEIIAELAREILASDGQDVPNIRPPRDVLDNMLQSSPAGLTLEEVEAAPNGIDLGPLRPCMADRLMTEDKQIQCAHPDFLAELQRFSASLADEQPDSLCLIGRRHVRSNNSWLHNSKRLLKGPERCTLMIHPDDAAARGLEDGGMATVTGRVNSVEIVVEITDDVMPGVVSIPHGFGHGRKGVGLSVAREKPGVSLNDLTDPESFDPLSGNAVLNATPVTVEPAMEIVAAE
ncbi:Anaerobic selenocysteine-containing dehydrogenase [Parasphingorhabdus marina DSM 22363]|uniref:Anaerobic selenocysteine-containing dehydrogenase n=1 Tax=Parasphingorhabdus marina DSM 22363 TaxID=1123272 RepID=A0A1N6FBN9_9SPHN|nr:molybdopterin oxidoreductase family protein [Parasphingorhabdus marina]SIN92688.1 Anaerobic selenocysteine-containing dehydrogenase [Parasphingorhabdus marina DSM 22363]